MGSMRGSEMVESATIPPLADTPLSPASTDNCICFICGALVARKLADAHSQWHKNISDVAIESTRRIERLERG
jgi:hypothetical protein